MAELPETISRRELGRRAGRPLSDDDLDTLNALGIVFPTKQGKFQVAIAHLSVGVALLDLGMPLDAALAAQDIFTDARPPGRRGAHRAVPHQGVAGLQGGRLHPRAAARGGGAVQAGDGRRPW